MRLTKERIILLLLLGFIAVVTVTIAVATEDKNPYIVKNFTVNDVPADDGSGLFLSWKPLPKERRIIEYRIYRGVSPDQLFFLSSIPVNVRTGVASEKMYFYDTGMSEFIEYKSPRRLRKEKQQGQDSPLYRKPPRDINVLAELLNHFYMVAAFDKRQYYYRTTKSFVADAEDSTAYAGLTMRQMTIRAGLKKDQKYYYTIVAVDERSVFHPHAEISEGVPVENTPDPAPDFNSVLLSDLNTLQFEWEYPLYKDDLVQYRILMLPKISKEDWELRKKLPEFGGVYVKPIASGRAGYSNYTSLKVDDLLAEGLSQSQIETSNYALALYDASGMASYSHAIPVKKADSSQLPPKPNFKVIDKPNDKGDRLTVIWSNPVVMVTKVSFTNIKNEKMKINYMLNAAETQKVRNIYFDFYKTGEDKPFKTINEFYPDNIITLKVPNGYNIKDGLRVVMKMRCEPVLEEDYQLEQTLRWDDQILSLNPGNVYNKGNNLLMLNNVVYQKPPSFPIFYQAKKMSSYDSNVEITIPYESMLYRGILAVNLVDGDSLRTYGEDVVKSRQLTKNDSRNSLILVDPNIDLMVDPKTKKVIRTSIYASEGKKDAEIKLKETQDKLTELKAQTAVLEAQAATSPQAAQELSRIKSQITSLEETLEMLNNPILQKANNITSNNARMRLIAHTREKDKRRASFYMVRTDGKGLFIESDEQKDENDEYIYHAPIANWFDKNKLTALFASLIFGSMVFFFVRKARKGHDLYIRPIAGIHEIDNAIGRATEMGRPILYIMGSGSLSDIPIIASLGILSQVAKKAAEYDTRLIVPCYDYIVMPVAQEVVREAHYEAGRPDSYDKNNVFYLTQVQFAYVAGVNGIMIREKVATNFFLGFFAAEALLMTETGNAIGAIQIAGSDAVTQIPFFITTCDYTLIGEELYAASAYLNREPMLLGTLKAQDYYKFLILSFIIVGAILSSFQITSFIRIFPLK